MRLNLKPSIKEWIKAFIYALLILLVVRNFFYQVYVVESDSMEGSLKKGDFVLVNKVSYGARFAVTPLCIPFSDWYISSVQLPYWRVPGFYNIEQNDVILFNYPMEENLPIDRRTKMIKRVIGLPGDTLVIENEKLIINSVTTATANTILMDFYVSHDATITEKEIRDEIYCYRIHVLSETEMIITTFPEENDNLKKIPGILKAELFDTGQNENLEVYFPHSPYYKFSLNHYGPVVIPKSGMTIELTPLNWPLYQQAITSYEKTKVSFNGTAFSVNEENTNKFTFKQDYFFVAGDNRHSSVDSRHWGFVPESHVIGKVNRILFSYGKGGDGIRWSRIFSSVE